MTLHLMPTKMILSKTASTRSKMLTRATVHEWDGQRASTRLVLFGERLRGCTKCIRQKDSFCCQ